MSAQLQTQGAVALPAEGQSLLDSLIQQSRVARNEVEHDRTRDLIGELVREVMDGTVTVSDNLSAMIDARIADIDRLISDQLSEVLHAPEFQKLESSWSGLHYLCKQTSTGEHLKIKVFNVSKKELVKDFKSLQGVFTNMIQGVMLGEGGSVDELVTQAAADLAEVK